MTLVKPRLTRAERMAKYRQAKRERKECRSCKEPAYVDDEGNVHAMCRRHLDEDAARRKAPTDELP